MSRRCAQREIVVVLLLLLIVATSPPAAFGNEVGASQQKIQIAGLDVAVWLPNPATPRPWPVVLFSHGFHGCSTQSTFLMEAIARSGYAVFAPNHRDSACRNMRAWLGRPEQTFRDPTGWTDETYADRAHDLERLIDALKADPRYGRLDWQHLALAGHSLGGYTVLGLSGAWPSWKDPRIKAVLALSPFTAPFLRKLTLGGIEAPVMYQGGTHDPGITPFVNKGNGAYDQTPTPKYYVEFDGAGHFAWTDIRDKYHAAIIEYCLAFLDRYLKDKPFPQALTKPHLGVSAVRIKE